VAVVINTVFDHSHRRRQDFLQGWAKIEAPSGKRLRREVEAPHAGDERGEVWGGSCRTQTFNNCL